MKKYYHSLLLVLLLVISVLNPAVGQLPSLHYEVTFPNPTTHTYHVELRINGLNPDTLKLTMPAWMPGYYQLMHYANDLSGLTVKDDKGKPIAFSKLDENTWLIPGRHAGLSVGYDITTHRQFVANSYVDESHAYLIPGNSFLYPEGYLNVPVSVRVQPASGWTRVATGLTPVPNRPSEFTAPDFDILYDCPILMGTLTELPSFEVQGIRHRFLGYQVGSFDQQDFINRLKKIVEASVAIIGHIPYQEYTFIGIGPGRGGIEHLNNTTVSFDGNTLSDPAAMNRMMNFLAHEYFHHYNVKRIRPYELGPFDYDRGSPTNLLWVSEGLSVYYEYLVVKRAGLADRRTLLANLENNLNQVENNPGRLHQSLVQASYNTWKEGPFGTLGNEKGKTISYYEKGPLVGMLLDFAIRQATQNARSLDDVMRYLYQHYYQQEQRGFTDAEFRHSCETVAAASLADVFEYVYTTREPDYNRYLAYGGLKVEVTQEPEGKKKFTIAPIENPDAMQQAIMKSWLGE